MGHMAGLNIYPATVNQGTGGSSPWSFNLSRWLGSTAPTVGQKLMASSIPVVIATDQTLLPITGTVTANLGTIDGVATEFTLSTRLSNAVFSSLVPAALVGGRFDVNVGAWLGSSAPTVGQKASAASIPVVIASDQSSITITGTVTANLGTIDGVATEPTLLTRLADATFTSRTPAALVGGRFDTNIGSWLGSVAPTVGQKTMAASIPVVIASDQGSTPSTIKSGTAVTAMASTNGPISSGTVSASSQSIAYLFHTAASTKRIEILRIHVSFSGPTNDTRTLSVQGAFITAENAVPGGTSVTINPLDRSDTVNAADVFRVGATGAPTRVAGDLISWTFNNRDSGLYVWDEDLTGKPIVLRLGVAEGFEIRSVIGGQNLSTASQIAVTFYWKEV